MQLICMDIYLVRSNKNTLGVSVPKDHLIRGDFQVWLCVSISWKPLDSLALPHPLRAPLKRDLSGEAWGPIVWFPVGFSHQSSHWLVNYCSISTFNTTPAKHKTVILKLGLKSHWLVSLEIFVEVHGFSVSIFLILCFISVIILRKKFIETCSGLSEVPFYNKGGSICLRAEEKIMADGASVRHYRQLEAEWHDSEAHRVMTRHRAGHACWTQTVLYHITLQVAIQLQRHHPLPWINTVNLNSIHFIVLFYLENLSWFFEMYTSHRHKELLLSFMFEIFKGNLNEHWKRYSVWMFFFSQGSTLHTILNNTGLNVRHEPLLVLCRTAQNTLSSQWGPCYLACSGPCLSLPKVLSHLTI